MEQLCRAVVSVDEPRPPVTRWGARLDGLDDDTAAFQAAIDAVGCPYVPPGAPRIDGTLYAKKPGDGLAGPSSALVTLRAGSPLFARSPAATGLLRGIRLEGLTIESAPASRTAHGNGQSYADGAAVDLTGISFARLYDVHTHQWQHHFKLDYSVNQTYKNVIIACSSWGGECGYYFGGSAAPRDGANSNTVLAGSTMAMQVHYFLRGGMNAIVAPRMENPMQSAGYPATATGVVFEPGYYCIGNAITGAYVELVGTGHKAVHYRDNGLSGYFSPNEVSGGGLWPSNAPVVIDPSMSVFGQTLDAPGLSVTCRTVKDANGGTQTITYLPGGGQRVQGYTTNPVVLQHETYGTAVPTAGTYPRGAVVWNRDAAVGAPQGWRCVSAGSPGTWAAMPNL